MHRSHLAWKEPQLARCSKCDASVRPHRVCPNCGWYRDVQVIDRDTAEI